MQATTIMLSDRDIIGVAPTGRLHLKCCDMHLWACDIFSSPPFLARFSAALSSPYLFTVPHGQALAKHSRFCCPLSVPWPARPQTVSVPASLRPRVSWPNRSSASWIKLTKRAWWHGCWTARPLLSTASGRRLRRNSVRLHRLLFRLNTRELTEGTLSSSTASG